MNYYEKKNVLIKQISWSKVSLNRYYLIVVSIFNRIYKYVYFNHEVYLIWFNYSFFVMVIFSFLKRNSSVICIYYIIMLHFCNNFFRFLTKFTLWPKKLFGLNSFVLFFVYFADFYKKTWKKLNLGTWYSRFLWYNNIVMSLVFARLFLENF